MARWQQSRCLQALCLLLSLAWSRSEELTTYYTVEYPEYSFAAQEVTLVYTIEAPAGGSAPAPLSLTTVLDRSESMSGRKLDLLKKTNQFLVETMKKNSGLHDMGIVTYSNLLDELVKLQSVTDQTGPLMNYRIQNIQAAGSTFLSGGLTKGLEQQKHRPSNKVQSVYLFTDGLPTVGPTKSWEILNEVRKIRDSSEVPISIYTFGFGEDVDAQLLWDIANEGNGVAYVIANENDIPVAFGDALGALLSSFAQDVRVLFKPTGGSRIKKIESPGQVNVLSDGSVEVKLFDLFAEETRDILVTVEAPATNSPGFQQLLYVDTKYKDAVTRKSTGGSTVTIGCERVPEPIIVEPAERVEVTRIYIITSEALTAASDKVESGDQGGASVDLEEAEKRVLGSRLKDRPVLSRLLKDIRKVREAVVDRVVSRTRGNGLLRNLVSAVRDARSSRTGSDQLETAEAQDTATRRETREAASQGVLGDRDFVVRPAPLGTLEGDEDTGSSDSSSTENDGEEDNGEEAQGEGEEDDSSSEDQENESEEETSTDDEEVSTEEQDSTDNEEANAEVETTSEEAQASTEAQVATVDAEADSEAQEISDEGEVGAQVQNAADNEEANAEVQVTSDEGQADAEAQATTVDAEANSEAQETSNEEQADTGAQGRTADVEGDSEVQGTTDENEVDTEQQDATAEGENDTDANINGEAETEASETADEQEADTEEQDANADGENGTDANANGEAEAQVSQTTDEEEADTEEQGAADEFVSADTTGSLESNVEITDTTSEQDTLQVDPVEVVQSDPSESVDASAVQQDVLQVDPPQTLQPEPIVPPVDPAIIPQTAGDAATVLPDSTDASGGVTAGFTDE